MRKNEKGSMESQKGWMVFGTVEAAWKTHNNDMTQEQPGQDV